MSSFANGTGLRGAQKLKMCVQETDEQNDQGKTAAWIAGTQILIKLNTNK